MTVPVSIVVLSTAVIAVVASLGVRSVLMRRGVLDIPTHRSSHATPVPRGGGIAPLATIVTGLLLTLVIVDSTDRRAVAVVLGVAVASGLLGWLEDSRGVSTSRRAAAHLVIAVLGVGALGAGTSSAWWLLPLATLGVAGYINVANFMDGINGISGMHGATVGAALAVLGWGASLPWLVVTGCVVGLAFAAFLTVNLSGRVFLGDTGSYLLGGSCSIIAVAAALAGVPVVAVLAPLAIYLADGGVTLARRMIRGDRWTEAHREHVYQRLVDSGWSHIRCSGLVAGLTVTTSALGVAHARGLLSAGAAAAGLVAVAVCYLALPRLAGASGPARKPTREAIS